MKTAFKFLGALAAATLLGCEEVVTRESAQLTEADLYGSYTLWYGDSNEYAGDGPSWCHWQDLHTADPWVLCSPLMPVPVTCADVDFEGTDFELSAGNIFSGATADTQYQVTGPLSVQLGPSGENLLIQWVPGKNGTQAYVTFAENCMVQYYREAE